MVDTQPENRADKSRIILVGIILITAILVVYLLMTGGTQSVWDVAKRFFNWALIFMCIALIVWVVMKLLQKTPIDLVENNRQDIIDAAILSKPPMVRDLYFSGDKGHGEFRVGTIIGFCQLQSYKDTDIIAGMTKEQLKVMKARGEIPSQRLIKEDCFVFKRMPFPASLFEQPKVLRTFEDEHSQLIGDVKVYGVSMVKSYSFYWPNRAHLDIARIDIGVIREAWRGQIHQFLKDAVAIQQRAVGLDAEHKKTQDNRKLLKIPSPLGNQDETGSR